MSEKMSFFKKLEKNRIWQVVVFFALEVVVLGIYFIGGKKATEEGRIDTVRNQSVVVDFSFLNELEDISVRDGKVYFSGWAFYAGAENKDLFVVLQETEGTEEYILRGDLFKKDEIVEYYMPEMNPGEIGFCTSISESELDKDTCYEILLSITSEKDNGVVKKKVSTGNFYYNGEVYRYNPKEFSAPNVNEDRIVQVFENGTLRVYDSNEGIWVYQYEAILYYIIDSRKCYLSKDVDTGIIALPRTSCIDLLPEERQKDGKDNLGMFYSEKNYNVGEEMRYQIVEVDLPLEYPLTYISTGVYDDAEKKWINNFIFPMCDWRMYDVK